MSDTLAAGVNSVKLSLPSEAPMSSVWLSASSHWTSLAFLWTAGASLKRSSGQTHGSQLCELLQLT
jgi:hypothetical protein